MCQVLGVRILAWGLVMSAALPSSHASLMDTLPSADTQQAMTDDTAKRELKIHADDAQTDVLRSAESERDLAAVPADNDTTGADLTVHTSGDGDDHGGDQQDNVTAVERYASEPENREERDATSEPTSCLDVQKVNTSSGIHTLYVDGQIVDVFCDQVTDGGGWVVLQRRRDGSVNFDRNWKDYVKGFGQLDGEFWLGLDNMHLLTAARRQLLRIDLFDYDGYSAYEVFYDFKVGGADNYYRLYFSSCTGSAGDSLSYSKYMPFSTKDADHDVNSGHCAQAHSGGWWHKSCVYANLNGLYASSKTTNTRDIYYYAWKRYYSLKFVEMKIRPY